MVQWASVLILVSINIVLLVNLTDINELRNEIDELRQKIERR